MSETEIYLIRHGQTEWNLEGRWQGQMNSDLTPLGVAQAKAVARRLETVEFHMLYSSDLTRTYDTAKEIAATTGHEIVPEERLRERRGGLMEGHTLVEAQQKFPEHFEVELHLRPADFAFPGGESENQLRDRAMDVLTELAERHPGERIVAVSHGAILNTFLRHILGTQTTSWAFRLNNCGLSVVTHGKFRRGNWMVNTINEIGYLDGIESAISAAE